MGRGQVRGGREGEEGEGGGGGREEKGMLG